MQTTTTTTTTLLPQLSRKEITERDKNNLGSKLWNGIEVSCSNEEGCGQHREIRKILKKKRK